MPLAAGWPRSRLYCSLFTALTSLSVLAVLLSFRMEPVHPYRFGFLMIASACFLLVAVLGGALRSVYGRFIFTGLLCCALGDYVGFRNFVWGAIAFLVAHVERGGTVPRVGAPVLRVLFAVAVYAAAALALLRGLCSACGRCCGGRTG